jgi:acetolactate synthase-1/3 small subunit
MTTFHILIDRAEGSLQRLIGLVERRGFEVERFSMTEAGMEREVRMSVRARDNGRSSEVLGRQIDRLIGVRRVPAPATVHVESEAAPCLV